MKKKRIILQVIIGISIIAFIIYKIGINDVIMALKKTDALYFILACLFYLCMNLALSTRLRYLLTVMGHKIKFQPVFISHMGGMIVGDITPGRSGYFLTPHILKKNAGIPITDGMACIFAPQAIEFILKVAGAFAAIIFISTFSYINKYVLVTAGLGATFLLVVGILMLVVSWKNENISSRFLGKIPFIRKYTENLLPFKEKSIGLKNSINVILLLYMVAWFFAALHWFYLAKALGIELSLFTFFLLHPLITLLMFMPGLPAGFGLVEGGVVFVFSLFGVPLATALAFSILVRVSMLIVDMTGLKTVLSSLPEL